MSDVNYAEIDPGVRDLVRLLNDNGFTTTDSGDGISKAENITLGFAEASPHVYMVVSEPQWLIREAHRLLRVITRHTSPGIFNEVYIDPVTEQSMPRVLIEASYQPMSSVALLSLHGISDKDLRGEYRVSSP